MVCPNQNWNSSVLFLSQCSFSCHSGIKLEKEGRKENDYAFALVSGFYLHETEGLRGEDSEQQVYVFLHSEGACGPSGMVWKRNFPNNFDLSSKLMIRKTQIGFCRECSNVCTSDLLSECSS